MASFISTLSLFILVLSSGCFALPFVDQELSSPTSSSLYDDLTTEQSFNLRLVPDDETTVSAETEEKRSADEHIGFQMSTSADGLLEENVTHGLRTFDELSTSEPTTFTTEQSYYDKYNQNDLSFSTVEPITQATVLQRRGFTSGLENETETETDKQEMEVKLTKSDTVVYTSTSSAILPKLYTSESSTSRSSSSSSVAPQVFTSQSSTSSSTSTEKYTGLMKDENEHEHDHDHENEHDHDHEHEYEQTTKYMKTQRTATSKSKVTSTKKSKVQLENKSEEDFNESKVQSEDKSEEDSKDSTVPTAVFDQEALKKISNVPNDFMILDENNDTVVPSLPTKISTSTIKNKKEQKALNQGKESSQSEEKESNHRNGSSSG